MTEKIRHINPEGMMKSPAFSQAVMTQGSGRTIYVGGQNAVNSNGEVVGKGDVKVQTWQVMENIRLVLEACGATYANLVKLNINLVPGLNISEAYQTAQTFFEGIPAPPSITVLFVAGLGKPEYLLEVDAVAFIPD